MSTERPDPIHADWPTLKTLSVRYVARVLAHVNGDKRRAAELLDIDERTLRRVLARGATERTRPGQGHGNAQ